MSQLPFEYECPVDWIIIRCCKYVAPIFKKTKHTANIITTEGAIASAFGLYNLYYGRLHLFAIGYSLGYAFDCLDGHFARRYNSTSKFGEYYEHGKDVITSAAYFYILLTRYKVTLPVTCLFLVLGSGLCVHMGHQQKYLKSKGTVLDFLTPLCRNVKNLKFTRWLGCGTFMVASVVVPFFLKRLF